MDIGTGIGLGISGGVACIATAQVVIVALKSRSNGRYVHADLCDAKMESIGNSLDRLTSESSEMRSDIRVILTLIRNGGSKS